MIAEFKEAAWPFVFKKSFSAGFPISINKIPDKTANETFIFKQTFTPCLTRSVFLAPRF